MYIKSRTERFNVILNTFIGLTILIVGLVAGALVIGVFNLPVWTYDVPLPITIVVLLLSALSYRIQRKAVRRSSANRGNRL